MQTLPYYVVNAFSEGAKAFTGNPAGVILDGDQVPDTATKQAIARQLNLVETVFVCRPSQGADFRFQYFTPTKELPVTGHPTIAGLGALLSSGRLDGTCPVSIETAGGLLQAKFEGDTIWITQRPPVFRPVNVETHMLAQAFGLSAKDIDARYTPEVSDTGLGHIVVRLKSREALNRARVDIERLAALCEVVTAREAQLFSVDSTGACATRNLCPRLGEEDPACGNGNAALGAWLAKNGLFLPGESLSIAQGELVHRPSRVCIRRGPDAAGEIVILIGGTARKMAEGTFYI